MLRVLLALVIVLGACRVKEEKWPLKAAKAQCDYYRRCDTSWFFRNYEDTKECVDLSEDWLDAKQETDYAECNYSAKNARKCLKALGASCKSIGRDYADVEETCFAVYDCGDELVTGGDTGETIERPTLTE